MTTASIVAAIAGACAGLALAHAWTLGDRTPANWTLGRSGASAGPRRSPLTRHLAAAVTGMAVGWALLGTAGLPLGGTCALMGMRATAGARQRRGAKHRERGVGALARGLADAVRAGHSVRGAMHAAAADQAIPPALRRTMVEADAALQRGAALPAVLHGLGQRGGPQLVLLCAVMALHAERGGRLPQALDRLAEDADRAVRLDEERAAATAQARATVRTVAALPILALLGAQVLGGNLIAAVAQHPISLGLLLAGLLLEVAAVVIAHRLVTAAA